jgi:hypothetical protein
VAGPGRSRSTLPEAMTALLAAMIDHTSNGVVSIPCPQTCRSTERKKSQQRNWQMATPVVDTHKHLSYIWAFPSPSLGGCALCIVHPTPSRAPLRCPAGRAWPPHPDRGARQPSRTRNPIAKLAQLSELQSVGAAASLDHKSGGGKGENAGKSRGTADGSAGIGKRIVAVQATSYGDVGSGRSRGINGLRHVPGSGSERDPIPHSTGQNHGAALRD